jgi:hypothetical protein
METKRRRRSERNGREKLRLSMEVLSTTSHVTYHWIRTQAVAVIARCPPLALVISISAREKKFATSAISVTVEDVAMESLFLAHCRFTVAGILISAK